MKNIKYILHIFCNINILSTIIIYTHNNYFIIFYFLFIYKIIYKII